MPITTHQTDREQPEQWLRDHNNWLASDDLRPLVRALIDNFNENMAWYAAWAYGVTTLGDLYCPDTHKGFAAGLRGWLGLVTEVLANCDELEKSYPVEGATELAQRKQDGVAFLVEKTDPLWDYRGIPAPTMGPDGKVAAQFNLNA